jgi:transposase-like protein
MTVGTAEVWIRGSRLLWLQEEVALADVEIIARVERRRKWTAQEEAALPTEVEAEGGKVTVVARRHRITESVLYNWRAACKAAAAAVMRTPVAAPFIPLSERPRWRRSKPAETQPLSARRGTPERFGVDWHTLGRYLAVLPSRLARTARR